MQIDIGTEEAQAIAHEAFVYGFPLVENYKLMYANAVIPNGFNVLVSKAKLYGPKDTQVVTPNNDTAYSQAWVDLRAEPMVLSIPKIDPERYWSFQLIDYFTNNFAYVGLRATGPATEEQHFLLAGPGWTDPGDLPEELSPPIRSSSQFMLLVGRTQVFRKLDVAVAEIQSKYKLTPLHSYLGTPAPAPAPAIDFIPFDPSLELTLAFFAYMNQTLSWETLPQDDVQRMKRFAKIRVGPGLTFDPDRFSPPVQQAMEKGIQRAYAEVKAYANSGETLNGWKMTDVTMPYFGTSNKDYLFRASIAYKGIYANTPIEALYPLANNDVANAQLTGAQAYTITFEPGQWPPADYFWSLTMYDATTQLLVENPIHRYSISDRTDGVQTGTDGSLQFYLQNASPGSDKESNWLPAPTGTFYVVLRVYGPQAVMLEGGKYGSYKVPGITPVTKA